jgi:GntR family transcriptional regulator/MocR family aminotransferase
MDLIFELPFEHRPGSPRPTAKAVYELLKNAIIRGELAPGTRLPPTRASCGHFNLSRNTMVAIYERLATESLIVARRGAGTFVAPQPDHDRLVVDREQSDRDNLPETWFPRSSARPNHFASEGAGRQEPINGHDLRPGLVDPLLFPFDKFRRSMAKALRAMERSSSIHRGTELSQGNRHLRCSVADHITLMRAMACDPSDIAITSGAQQAFDLLARVLVEPGKTKVAVEEPCYRPLMAPFAAAGAKILPVPVDDQGLVVEQIPDDADIVCVCPSSQFPLGVALSIERRRQLLAWAGQRNALIIEDDYGGEFRTGNGPLKPLYAQGADNIFYVGTFSTSMFPSLRLGFLVSPRWAVGSLIEAKCLNDWHSSSVVQAATATFIDDGHLSAHIARMRNIYRQRRTAAFAALDAEFGELLRPLSSSYGMHVAAIGASRVDWDGVAAAAVSQGIRVRSLSRYYEANPQPGLVIGLGRECDERLLAAIRKLALLVRSRATELVGRGHSGGV